MPAFSDDKLLELNHQGLIPGPGETSETFAKRADYCLTLKQHLSEELKAEMVAEESDDPAVVEASNSRLSAFYDIAPSWIPVFFSNYRLPFWHGGCAWIFQTAEDSPTAALIQLRQAFRHSESYLGIYKREELLTHELVHVARMSFQEPHYEEMLAYQTAHSAFRRWFGPIVQSSMESVIFILILGLIVVFDVFLIALGRIDGYIIALWLKLIPLALVVYALMRLWRRQRSLKKCINGLSQCLSNPAEARAVACRLTDSEIEAFAKMSPSEIKAYASLQAEKELRWRVIMKAYLGSS